MSIKPKLRAEAKMELRASISNFVETLLRDGSGFAAYKTNFFPFKNCLNCIHFNEDDEICKWYKQKPPARVIAYGCESHDDIEEIPF